MKKMVLCTALALISGWAYAQKLQPISIGVLLPQSGVYANLGNALRNGAILSLQDAKEEFAKLGFELQLKNFDDQGVANTAISKAAQIMADPTVLIAIGPAISDVSMAVTPLFAKRNLAVVNPFSIVDELTEQGWNNVVRIVPRADSFTVAEADYVLERFKAKSITLINNGSLLGIERMNVMSQRFKKKGAKVVSTFTIGLKSDFDAVAKRIVKDNPETVHLSVSQYTVSGGMVNALRKAGYDGGLFTSAVLNPAFAKLTGDNYPGLFYISNITTLNAYPQAASFVNTYRKQFKYPPTPVSLIGHDAMEVALEGLRAAIKDKRGKLPNRQNVQTAIRTITVKGFTGELGFSKSGDRLKSTIFVLQVGPDSLGRVVGAINSQPPKR